MVEAGRLAPDATGNAVVGARGKHSSQATHSSTDLRRGPVSTMLLAAQCVPASRPESNLRKLWRW